MQGPDQGFLAERDLVGVVFAWLRAVESSISRSFGRRVIESATRKNSLGVTGAPRHRCNAAERDTSIPDASAVEIERNRRRGERELVGFPVADL